jgi:hypothetical protein
MVGRGDWKLRSVVQTRIIEVSLAAHSRFATSAFQCGTDPHPVHVCKLIPANPKAGGIRVAAGLPSGRTALPSKSNSASNFPGPQLFNTLCTVA